jgi:hypothetical protein
LDIKFVSKERRVIVCPPFPFSIYALVDALSDFKPKAVHSVHFHCDGIAVMVKILNY